jgi:hypothetical protein
MKFPAFLTEKFSDDHKLNAFVSHAAAKVSGHISANDLIFFPEYTDHGIPHLEATLQTAIDLANSSSKKILTGQDAAALSFAPSWQPLRS